MAQVDRAADKALSLVTWPAKNVDQRKARERVKRTRRRARRRAGRALCKPPC